MLSYRSLWAGLAAVSCLVATTAGATAAGARPGVIEWRTCGLQQDAQCATLTLPVDWSDPGGATFGLAIARRPATDPGARVGTLIFGPGGPGDSGMDRVANHPGRFSDELRRCFDIRVRRCAAPGRERGSGLTLSGSGFALTMCLGWPKPVANPQHVLRVHTSIPMLLLNSRHEPATGYNWAVGVARQLGRRGVLVTYEGAGHGSYGLSDCMQQIADQYLIGLTVPGPGTTCGAAS